MAMAKWGRLSTGLRLSMNQLIEEVNEQHQRRIRPVNPPDLATELSARCQRSGHGLRRTPYRGPFAVSRRAPSNRVNVALIGCGNIGGRYHLGILSPMPDVRIVAVADAYTSRREAVAAKLNEQYGETNAVKAYADFREILARPDVDAVIIGAHDNWHTPMSIAAAKAGKDVYCQKPLALDLSLTKMLREVIKDKKRIFQFGTQYRSFDRYRHMVQLVRNGYIGQLTRMDVWCRDVSFNELEYSEKTLRLGDGGAGTGGSRLRRLDGSSEMVPYTVDRATCWGGYHCPETSLGFIAGCGIHELGLAQWGNKADHTSPIRYEGTGMVPSEGIFRTLARWDVTCDYANGVKLRLMDHRTAREAVGPTLPTTWRDGDGIIFHGTEGWISDALGFCASDQSLWKAEFKPNDEQLMVSPEHNRNFIDCVKSRHETICPVEMAIRCDTICHLSNIAARTGRVIRWDPEQEEIVGDD